MHARLFLGENTFNDKQNIKTLQLLHFHSTFSKLEFTFDIFTPIKLKVNLKMFTDIYLNTQQNIL